MPHTPGKYSLRPIIAEVILVLSPPHPFSATPLLLNTNIDPRDRSSCILTYDEQEQWLQATWRGFVDDAEALAGGASYLEHAARCPSPFLLNDNTALRGPWFDTLGWLAEVWVPEAVNLGLQYVAHVVQADRSFDIIPTQLPLPAPFELQVFQDLAQARHWLRAMRNAAQATTSPLAS